MAWYKANAYFHRLLQATKTGRSARKDDEISPYNLTVFQIFYLTVGKVSILIPLKNALFCSLKVHTLKKVATVGSAVQHGLYTSNSLPTPM